jgi:hypothetical protein
MGTIENPQPAKVVSQSTPSSVSYKNITERAKAIIIEAFTLFLISEESVIDEGKKQSFLSLGEVVRSQTNEYC